MENLHIPGSDRAPAVDFDFAAGLLTLRGESYPEDASRVFGPIFTALDAFLPQAKGRRVIFDMELIYFNSSSAKALMTLFLKLDQAGAQGVEIIVNWRFLADDETMIEFGEDFSEDLEHVAFNLVSFATAG
jgi:SiaC family regulatory phosphoprotein